ncbi:hypothetical protein BDN67DRAFT_964468 [Paxillus ammoniavirescens]|nr:hypothetical protein BDN67DRAFT_964468 [Paxillus ammoniavirescens]
MSSPTESSAPPAVSEPEPQHAQVTEPPLAVGHSTPADKPASTSPIDVKNIPAEQIKKPSEVNRDDPNINVVELPPKSPTFKEKVYGYAKVIRGTVLAKPGVKEEGEQVLRGEQTIPEGRRSQSSK